MTRVDQQQLHNGSWQPTPGFRLSAILPPLTRSGCTALCRKDRLMGAALYIALENKIPNLDTIIDGKMLSRTEKQLAKAAKRLGVRPLMDFFSTSADEAADLL